MIKQLIWKCRYWLWVTNYLWHPAHISLRTACGGRRGGGVLESHCAGLNLSLNCHLDQATPGRARGTLLRSLPGRCGFRHLLLSAKDSWIGQGSWASLQEELWAKGSVGKLGLSVGLRPVFQHDSKESNVSRCFWSKRKFGAIEEVRAPWKCHYGRC